jgi:hypothetical protein
MISTRNSINEKALQTLKNDLILLFYDKKTLNELAASHELFFTILSILLKEEEKNRKNIKDIIP